MIIGKFNKTTDGGLSGFIDTFGAQFEVVIVPHSGAIDYRVLTAHDTEIGIAWNKTSAKGHRFISVKLDGPLLPAPLNCALFEREGPFAYVLVWDRSEPALKAAAPDKALPPL